MPRHLGVIPLGHTGDRAIQDEGRLWELEGIDAMDWVVVSFEHLDNICHHIQMYFLYL